MGQEIRKHKIGFSDEYYEHVFDMMLSSVGLNTNELYDLGVYGWLRDAFITAMEYIELKREKSTGAVAGSQDGGPRREEGTMAYVRKTHDEWWVQGDYGYGWEDVCPGEDRKDAQRILHEYRENDRRNAYRLKMHRVRNDD